MFPPEDSISLLAPDCLDYRARGAQPRWTLRNGRRTETVAVTPRVVGNQMTSLVRLALEGAGVALVPLYLCRAELASARLVRVLPHWTGPLHEVSLVLPTTSSASARLKLVAERLSAVVQKAIRLE